MYGRAHFRVPVTHDLQQIADLCGSAQLLSQLALEGLTRRLARAHLPAGEFPLPAKDPARLPLADQHSPVLLDNSRYHPYHRGHTTTAANDRHFDTMAPECAAAAFRPICLRFR